MMEAQILAVVILFDWSVNGQFKMKMIDLGSNLEYFVAADKTNLSKLAKEM